MTRTDRELRDFLTGRLPEAEVEPIEQEALQDASTFQQLEALEEELVFDYARGSLTPDERRWLETHTLAAAGGPGRLAEARAMLAAFDRMAEPRAAPRLARSHPVVWAGLAAAAGLILALGLQTWSLRNQLSQTREQLVRATAEVERLVTATRTSPPPPVDVRPGATTAPILAISLTPGLVRGAAKPVVVNLPAEGAAVLELRLTLPAAAPRPPYRFTVLDPDGASIVSGVAPAPANQQILLQIPTTHIPPDDYEIVLSTPAGGHVAAYALSVRRSNP